MKFYVIKYDFDNKQADLSNLIYPIFHQSIICKNKEKEEQEKEKKMENKKRSKKRIGKQE